MKTLSIGTALRWILSAVNGIFMMIQISKEDTFGQVWHRLVVVVVEIGLIEQAQMAGWGS
jgi:hypothetical protein